MTGPYGNQHRAPGVLDGRAAGAHEGAGQYSVFGGEAAGVT